MIGIFGGSQVINQLKNMIDEAKKNDVSDIHLEIIGLTGRVRYRIDGILQTKLEYKKEMLESIISRIKYLANLDITLKNRIQEGCIIGGELDSDDIRVSIIPTVLGEKAVLRIRNDKNYLDLEKIGFNQHNKGLYMDLLASNNGIILFTGPTGSGKSTTLLASIAELSSSDKNIITLEDPVELLIPGINQIYVNTNAGESFADYLRAILRQDPDIIMVGEIRDYETASMTTRAALTGHLVLSTVHADSSIGAITRLLEMGIPPYLVASTVKGVISQRLIRKLCLSCNGQGCLNCFKTGFKGRKAIHEIIRINDYLKAGILKGLSEKELLDIASETGFKSLRSNFEIEIENGVTSKSEMARVL
ncbi:type II/IV secretion system protein [Halanaerobiaceae bacterium Z-7014]|uniref:Type II/IV secretion system protein n=1 Tax=Halonatronomonas betaini TaxID=2778430 RepID=A0A931ATF0_9FIRM|nr:GspE/PulE family protein [Halonatronomonas betaini]MBF8437586.1 type II/IV secretion system protein [Halonatronomonas betaini]